MRLLSNCKTSVAKEEKHLLNVLDRFAKTGASFLDAGCGLGIWTDFVNKSRPDLKISCVDINDDLVSMACAKGYDAKTASVLELPYSDNEFDVVHCSHVIEHFGYPDVLKLLAELFRVTKPGGIVIIKSLLMGDTFFNDIDHIRPYYPETLANYFGMVQQQKTSTICAKEVYRWYVQYPPEYPKHARHRTIGDRTRLLLWRLFQFPRSSRVLYGIVFVKGGKK